MSTLIFSLCFFIILSLITFVLAYYRGTVFNVLAHVLDRIVETKRYLLPRRATPFFRVGLQETLSKNQYALVKTITSLAFFNLFKLLNEFLKLQEDWLVVVTVYVFSLIAIDVLVIEDDLGFSDGILKSLYGVLLSRLKVSNWIVHILFSLMILFKNLKPPHMEIITTVPVPLNQGPATSESSTGRSTSWLQSTFPAPRTHSQDIIVASMTIKFDEPPTESKDASAKFAGECSESTASKSSAEVSKSEGASKSAATAAAELATPPDIDGVNGESKWAYIACVVLFMGLFLARK